MGLEHIDTRTVEWLASEPAHQNAAGTDEGGDDDPFPADWEQQVDSWERPTRETLFEVIYTSGTTGVPKGVMLNHGTILSTLEAISRQIAHYASHVGQIIYIAKMLKSSDWQTLSIARGASPPAP